MRKQRLTLHSRDFQSLELKLASNLLRVYGLPKGRLVPVLRYHLLHKALRVSARVFLSQFHHVLLIIFFLPTPQALLGGFAVVSK